MLRIARLLFAVAAVFAIGCSRDPAAQSKRLVQNGNKFFDNKKYKEAAIMYRKALQKDAKNGDAYYRLGLASLQLADFPTAYKAFQRAATEQPTNIDAHAKYGDLLWAAYSQSPQNATQILADLQATAEDLLKRDPKSFDGLRFSGYIALANKDLPTALKRFEEAHNVKPYDPSVDMVYAQTLAMSKRMPEAEKVLQDLIANKKDYLQAYDLLINSYIRQQRMPEAEQLLKSMVASNPKNEAPLIGLATFYGATNRRPEMEATLQKLTGNSKDFPTARIATGAFFARRREFDRSKQELEQGMQADPKNKAKYEKSLAQVYLLQNKTAEASQLLAAVLKEDSKDSDALAMRAAINLRSQKQEEIKAAVSDLQGLVAKNGTNSAYRFQLAEGLLRLQPPPVDQARAQLDEVIKLAPNFAPARVLMAQIYWSPGQKHDASRALANADEAIRLAPNDGQAHLIRAGALMELKQTDAARKELTELAKAAPNSPEVKFQLGLLSFQDKNYREAENMFKEMQEVAPSDGRGFEGIVEAEAAQGNLKQAIAMAQAQVQKEPSRTDLRRLLANLLARDKQFDGAIREFQRVVQENPKDTGSYMNLGETLRLKGDMNSAAEAFKKAKAAAPAGEWRPALRLAMLLDAIGRRSEARPLYEEVLRANPNEPIALNNYAYLKAEEGGDLDLALTYAQRARGLSPYDTNVADTLGWVYIKKNLPEEAIRLYQEITQKDPKNATYRLHYATALLQKGDKRDAKQQLDVAMQNASGEADQGKIKDLLVKVGQ